MRKKIVDEAYQQEIDKLVLALGKSLCGAMQFCKEKNCLDCANCHAGNLAFRDTAVKLYHLNVRVEGAQPDKDLENEILKRAVHNAERERDKCKGQLEEIINRHKKSYVKALEELLTYIVVNNNNCCCEVCQKWKSRVYRGEELTCPAYDARGREACLAGMIAYFQKGSE